MAITLNDSKCPKDHRCPMIRMCPKKAISQDGFSLPKVDQNLCVECGICVSRCPHGAFFKK